MEKKYEIDTKVRDAARTALQDLYSKLESVHYFSSNSELPMRDDDLKTAMNDIINCYEKHFADLHSKDENINDVTRSMNYFATIAKKLINTKNGFGMAVLFKKKGSTYDDPNRLEEMISKLK